METNEQVKYSGFSTPCLILEGSDKGSRGRIIDLYAKTKDQDGLILGEWSVGFEDGLIHIYLIKPVAAICDERIGWVVKQTLLKEPIDYTLPIEGEGMEPSVPTKRKPIPQPKKRVELDPETKQFRLV